MKTIVFLLILKICLCSYNFMEENYIVVNALNIPSSQPLGSAVLSSNNNYMLLTYQQGAKFYQKIGYSFHQKGPILMKQNSNANKFSTLGVFSQNGQTSAILTTDEIIIYVNKDNSPFPYVVSANEGELFQQIQISKDGLYLIFTSVNTASNILSYVLRWDGNSFNDPYYLDIAKQQQRKLKISNNNNYLIACTNNKILIYLNNQEIDNNFKQFQVINTQYVSDCDITNNKIVSVANKQLKIYKRGIGSEVFSLSQNIDQFSQNLVAVRISNGLNQKIVVTDTANIMIYQNNLQETYVLQYTIFNTRSQQITNLDISDDSKYFTAVDTLKHNVYIYGACSNVIENCLICINQTYCSRCNQAASYYLNQVKLCSLCSTIIPNCQKCESGVETTCLKCSIGSFLKNSKNCEICIQANGFCQTEPNIVLIIILAVTIPVLLVVSLSLIIRYYSYKNKQSKISRPNFYPNSISAMNLGPLQEEVHVPHNNQITKAI